MTHKFITPGPPGKIFKSRTSNLYTCWRTIVCQKASGSEISIHRKTAFSTGELLCLVEIVKRRLKCLSHWLSGRQKLEVHGFSWTLHCQEHNGWLLPNSFCCAQCPVVTLQIIFYAFSVRKNVNFLNFKILLSYWSRW